MIGFVQKIVFVDPPALMSPKGKPPNIGNEKHMKYNGFETSEIAKCFD